MLRSEEVHRRAVPNLTVFLPCYNEAAALPLLLDQLAELSEELRPSWNLDVLVLDDGSTDGTAEIAASRTGEPDVHLVRHSLNRGLGAGLRTGLEWFLAHSTEKQGHVLAVMDADGTHPPGLLAKMLARLSGSNSVTGGCDVVIASRYAPGGEEHGLGARRRFYSSAASRVLRFLAPIRGACDYTCGYRAYRREILARAQTHYGGRLIEERGFVCMAELLVKLARRGAKVCEVPLVLHYEAKLGTSKMNVPATIWRYAVLALKLLLDPRQR
jgi:dolichol-phosphate mannosyltransferase